MAELKTALEGEEDAEITAKSEALSQALMKMGEAAYQGEQEAAGAAAGGGADSAADDGVVDAEFEEVDESKKRCVLIRGRFGSSLQSIKGLHAEARCAVLVSLQAVPAAARGQEF